MFPMMILMTLIMSILFMTINHPLTFGVILLIQTLLVSLMSGMMSYNFWFSYILFLIMVGGMLILFIYMTSVASNEKFKFSSKILLMLMILPMMAASMFFLDQMPLNWKFMSEDLLMKSTSELNKYSLMKFNNWPEMKIMISLITYLLITLIMAVKITNIKSGPLRQKF